MASVSGCEWLYTHSDSGGQLSIRPECESRSVPDTVRSPGGGSSLTNHGVNMATFDPAEPQMGAMARRMVAAARRAECTLTSIRSEKSAVPDRSLASL